MELSKVTELAYSVLSLRRQTNTMTWNWRGLDYIVKFNLMYLTDASQVGGEKEQIIAHLHGLWQHLIQDSIPFKAHWGKINFMDHAFVRNHYQLDQFTPFICPIFLNPYLAQRLLPAEY